MLGKVKKWIRKIMSFKEKIDKILETNKLGVNSVNGLEQFLKVSMGSISKPYKNNRAPGPMISKKILEELGINKRWWDSGEGDVFQNELDQEKVPEEVYRDLIESNTQYILVSKFVLNEEYRVMLKSEIDSKDRFIDKLMDLAEKNMAAKDKLIHQLEAEIKNKNTEIESLRSGSLKNA